MATIQPPPDFKRFLKLLNSNAAGLFSSYFPVFCHFHPFPAQGCELAVFREGKRKSSVELPVSGKFIAFAASGRAMYDMSPPMPAVVGPPVCIEKVELNPVRTTRYACSVGWKAIFALSVSADEAQVLVSGIVREAGEDRCGVFSIGLADVRLFVGAVVARLQIHSATQGVRVRRGQ
jgi:hypothetical protein